MSTQHTPGPWAVYHNGKCVGDETGHVASTDVEGATAEEAEANARLIAAAPDLLAFAIRAAEFSDYTHDDVSERRILQDLQHAAQALVAKAEGRS